jgi:nitronate monooxygenase
MDTDSLSYSKENRSLSLPAHWTGALRVPAIAAPMFLVSGPDLVVETCRSGWIGTFPALNPRTSEAYVDWLGQIRERLRGVATPFGVNLIVHRTNPRLDRDLTITVEHKVPLVITSLGAAREVVEAVHSYGGYVFHDVIHMHHARKAADAGVDGLIAVCAGAGGHSGLLSPFAFLAEIRQMFDKTLILSGSITNGSQIAAALLMGADLAYLGTRFIATRESLASDKYKQMVLDAAAKDIIYTPSISGVHGNFMRQSIEAAGLDANNLPPPGKLDMGDESKAWRNIWSAGHGVGDIHDIPSAAELCARLAAEFDRACARLSSAAGAM